MSSDKFSVIFTEDVLKRLFPAKRTNDFFEALFGDASDGAYDISLAYQGCHENGSKLQFSLDLKERPGCCLACNMTYGLPQVFSRHPVINVRGLVDEIGKELKGLAKCKDWQLGNTMPMARGLHSIPLLINIDQQ